MVFMISSSNKDGTGNTHQRNIFQCRKTCYNLNFLVTSGNESDLVDLAWVISVRLYIRFAALALISLTEGFISQSSPYSPI